ncbi:protein regulator of cytokinesis 1-like isoform X1 [Macrobrachium rosenbergii]|uniref:protein regulator of cytokinesis 1-like isoform X1 n=1 Tax=Macrobrachium rosenbergii TaxID=79674 RepID=UPI0034D58BFF
MESSHEEALITEYRKTSQQLQLIWDEIGFDPEHREVRVNHVNEELKVLLQSMVEKEKQFKKKMKSDIARLGQQFYNLNKDLHTRIAEPAENFSLLDLENFLRKNVETLMKEVRKRTARLKELQIVEEELCKRLVEEPLETPNSRVPALDDIEHLERRIRTLEQEKVNREKNFQHLQSRISELHEALEHKPNCTFEFDILAGMEYFVLSQRNLQKMKEMKADLEQKLEQNREESMDLKNQIQRLWDQLEVEEQERNDFLASVEGHAPSTMTKLREELGRLKVKQQQNLSKCINKMRREIEDYWEKCYISEEERNNFTDYISDEYSEKVLESHEQQVRKLTKYYYDNIAIFDKIEQRKELWEKFVDLEERANDPNRYGNRGGALLREEKERKTVKKDLPLIEKELTTMILSWEAAHGKNFEVMGMNIGDYIDNEWWQYRERKENEKKKKQTERVIKLNYESRMGTRPPAVKRRLPSNDTLRTSKLQRVSEDHPLSTKSKNTTRMALRERNQNSVREGHNSSEVSTYSHFAEGIHRRSQKDNIRSSSVSGSHKPSTSIYRQSPHRLPPGLPKTPKTMPRVSTRCSPKTLPRAPTRRSPRLSGTRSARRSSKAMTSSRIPYSPSSLGKSRNLSRVNFSPGASPLFKSPHSRTRQSSTPSKWHKLTFLI